MTTDLFPRIQVLPTEVVNLMAAGEVIDSLAAVVRELAENALDAEASRITISLWPEQWRVQVSDNGNGMDLADLQQAATPHATSKIRDRSDLWRIRSLGFRGEALHSLAQLADLTICSRPATLPTWEDGVLRPAAGWRASYDAKGEVVQLEPAAIAPGTIVTISELFRIWPARREALPAAAQKMRAVQLAIYSLALCHPRVTWQVQRDDRLWFAISPGETAQQIFPQVLRQLRFSDLQELQVPLPWPAEAEMEGLGVTEPSLYLVLGLPDRCHRRRADWIKVALNGRLVRSPELEQTLLRGFQRTLPRQRYPVCFLHLHLPACWIDWNRHPAKAEIYLHHLSHWQHCIHQAIDQALQLSPTELLEDSRTNQLSQWLKAGEQASDYRFPPAIAPNLSANLSDDLTTAIAANLATDPDSDEAVQQLPLRVVAQVRNTYILVEHPGGIWLVEQHIAHERVLYEQLHDRWQLVPLDPPIILKNLSPAQREQLQRLEIELDPFGEDLWAARTAPKSLAEREDCAAALEELSLGGDLQTAQVATACRTAVRNGTPLSQGEMQAIISQWQRTRNPRTCPHGRPIYLSLEETALARFFRRHWVIGKSHGI